MLPHCDFLDCPYLFSRCYAQVEPLDRFSGIMAQTTCFRARMVFLGVRTMDGHIWGKYAPTLPPKWGVKGQFQAKTAKYENRNISKTINRIKTKFEDQAKTNNSTSLVVKYSNITQIKSNMAAGRHLEKNGYDVITRPSIVRLLQSLAGRCIMTCR